MMKVSARVVVLQRLMKSSFKAEIDVDSSAGEKDNYYTTSSASGQDELNLSL